MRPAALLLMGLHLACAGTHSLQYLFTVVSGDIVYPEFTAVGMINDQQFMYFDSNTRTVVPKTEWINADDWDNRTQTVIDTYQEYKNDMKIIMDHFKHSKSGVHTLQMMYGCELEHNVTTQGHMQIGYDGEDLIGFDKNTLSWINANPQAVILKNQWESKRAQSESWKTFLEITCIERLEKYVRYGKKTLERKVPPEVSLLQKNPSSSVTCHATGFYPSNITMSWKKNYEDHRKVVVISSTLPNADGTFQKSISLSVKPEDWKNSTDLYRCVIQHVGAGREIVVLLNEQNIKSNSGSVEDSNLIFICMK